MFQIVKKISSVVGRRAASWLAFAACAVLLPTQSTAQLENRKITVALYPQVAANSDRSNRSSAAYSALPLSFEDISGTATEFQFLSHGLGYSALFTANQVVFSMLPCQSRHLDPLHAGAIAETAKNVKLRMTLIGANANAPAAALDKLSGTSAYFIGSDPKNWRTNVSNYAKIQYENIYPGVDLVYYGNQRELEYDFIVTAGADPNKLTFDLAADSYNAVSSYIDSSGDLVSHVDGVEVRLRKPVIYQESGAKEKMFVPGGFVRRGKHRFGFEVTAYDHSRPLIIDPATYFGGSGEDSLTAVAFSSTGVYIAGSTASNDLPGTTARSGSQRTDSDAFVALLSSDLKTLIQATYVGGTQDVSGSGIANDQANAISVSAAGVYVAGLTSSGDFPGLIGGAQPYNAGGPNDGFVALFSPDLKTLIQSTCLGHLGDDRIYALTATPGLVGSGNGVPQYSVFVAGYTDSKYFPMTAGGAEPISNLGLYSDNTNTTVGDGFAAVFSADLKTLNQATYLGGGGFDAAFAIAVPPPGGFVYVAGGTASDPTTSFPTPNPAQPSYGGGAEDGFVVELTSDLVGFVGGTYVGGSARDEISSIAVLTSDTGSNQVYVAGFTYSTDLPGTPSSQHYPGQGSAQGTNVSVQNNSPSAFVSLLDEGLGAIENSTYLGGTAINIARALAALPGHIYVAGNTTSADFPHTHGGLQPTYLGGSGIGDAFLIEISPDLSNFRQATYIGGAFDDEALGIAVSHGILRNDVYVVGQTESPTFVPSATEGVQPAPSRFDDGFVAELFLDPSFSVTNVAAFEGTLTAYVSTDVTVTSVNSFSSIVNFSVFAPSGFTASLNPPSLQVPSGGTVSTALSLTLGPSVTPGTYTVDLQATSGTTTDSVPVIVNVVASTAGTTQVVSELRADGCINSSFVANGLASELNFAQAHVNAGRNQAALDVYAAMLLEIAVLEITRQIDSTCIAGEVRFNPTLALVADIRGLMANLKTGTAANPITGYILDSCDVGIAGVNISLLNAEGMVLTTATTDFAGFYFFASSDALSQGSVYTVEVTSIPKWFKRSSPPSQMFTWAGTGVTTLQNFVLN